MKIVSLILTIAVACAGSANVVLASSAGPPDGRTNAPGETNCTACHTSFPLNSGAGSLAVSGVPESWQADTTYDLTVTLSDPDAQRWGFEFTILDQNGESAGSLASVDANTQISLAGLRTYAKQTSPGTAFGTTGSHSWTVSWTAPAAGAGELTLYAAGNAANGDFSSGGDRIYATSVTWTDGGLSPAPLPTVEIASLKGQYPNPFNPRTTILFELAQSLPVRLDVYSVDGRLVRRLVDGVRETGEHAVVWDGLDETGRVVPSGTYLYRLDAGPVRETRRMTLVR